MSKFYSNKVVWITGASSGLGEELTYALNEAGAKLIISARRGNELQRVKSNCKTPDTVMTFPLDVTDVKAVFDTVSQILELTGKVDIAILNAGISQRSYVKDTLLTVDHKIMNVNYFGVINCVKALLPSMIQHQLGHFVVISSVTGKTGVALRSAYAASKHALHGFFDSLRAEVTADHLKISMICLGYVRTNISINALKGKGELHGVMDENQQKGLSPKKAAEKILKAVRKGKREAYFGGKEIAAIYLKRFFPSLLAKLLEKERAK